MKMPPSSEVVTNENPTACLFPTTTVFLDDDPDYLESLLSNISTPRLKTKPFDDQNAVANYLATWTLALYSEF